MVEEKYRSLVDRDPDIDLRRAKAMREGTMARRYRTAYLGLGLFVFILLYFGLRLIGLV